MFRVPSRLHFLPAFGFVAALALGAAPANAADVDYGDAPPYVRRYDPPRYDPPPYYGEREYGRPLYAVPAPGRHWGSAEGCRVVYRRGVDGYGQEVVRRLRVCDEGVVEPRRAWVERPRYEDVPDVYRAPRPPREVGRDYGED